MESDLPRIFDAYYQAQEGRQRGGSGLGLALARWVVEQHGGAVAAANQPQGGCVIRFSLPLQGAVA
ncbi:sensor histidine kinase [Novosphingobium pokkalii]